MALKKDRPEGSTDPTSPWFAPQRPPDLIGGRYRVGEPLGVGGMSVVWRARDEVLGRSVAVKVLAAEYAADPAFRDHIRAEAKAAALLTHPHVTNVYDFGEEITDDGSIQPYVVMELVEGVSLATELEQGPLSWPTALEMGAQTAAALGAAHIRGLVHRDITPANIMITDSGVKVVDFGISAVVGEQSDGPVVGTPAYVAPERLTRGEGGPAADVYALAVVVYRALTGRLPWSGPTPGGKPTPLPPIPGLPDQVGELLVRALADDPTVRPTAAAMSRTLASAAAMRGAADPVRRGDAERDGAPELGDPPATRVLGDPTSPDSAGPRTATSPDGEGLRTATSPDGGELGAPLFEAPRTGTRILLSPRRADDDDVRPHRNVGYGGSPTWAAAAVILVALLAAAVITVVLSRPDGPTTPTAAATRGAPVTGGEPSQAPAGTGTGTCAVRYTVRSAWEDGATVDLAITNTGPVAITGWTLEFELVGGLTVGGTWNGTWRQSGDIVTVEAADYNKVLAPGQPLGAGPGANLSGKGSRSAQPPSRFRLNGQLCAG